MLSLIIVTALYVLVAAVAVGAWNWTKFEGSEASLAAIMNDVSGQTFWGTLLALGAVISIASVVLTVLYGQTRILFAMSATAGPQGARQGRRQDRRPAPTP
ncbi:hypothetical protein SGLAM104S_00754 [Streptomyces glaucescens]